jgi:hypothetical protein
VAADVTGGDCYVAAYEAILALRPETGWVLCHGTATGVGGDVTGRDFSHAWIENDEWAIDASNGRDVILPKDDYYRIGSVRDVTRYTRVEAATEALRTGTYGPWED